MNKDYVILGLISVCTLLLVSTIYFYAVPVEKEKVVTKTKTVYVQKPFKIDAIVNHLLEEGVQTAWQDKLGGVRTDCFSTAILEDHQSIFSYCKLKKKLLENNE